MRITDNAIFRLAQSHTMAQLGELSMNQLTSIIERCREYDGTDELLEDVAWIIMTRNLGHAMLIEDVQP